MTLFIVVFSLVSCFLIWAVYFITVMPERSYNGSISTLTQQEKVVRDKLQAHVLELAENIGERNLQNYPQLIRSAEYIEQQLQNYNYQLQSQSFNVAGKTVRNIIAELPGKKIPSEIIVIGAHYDSVTGSPGANDNGSGVAAMLEIASLLSKQELARTIRFIGFVNEEPPFTYTTDMGSYNAASQSYKNKENIIAMYCLETIGYYSDEAQSQFYPTPLSLFYPDTGNFIAFVSNINSRTLLRQSVKSFREHATLPSEGLAGPSWIGAINLSDHWSYWQQGYQALMVTDTAMFRYPYYHTINDSKDKIDYHRLAKVTTALEGMLIDVANNGINRN